ncbi:MAG: AMP-binding protein, partial [Sphingomonas sp.]
MALDPIPRPIDHLPARGAADAVALVDRTGTMTFAALEAAVSAVAGWLAARGLAPGDRVATWLPKTRLACVMPLATARAGLVHVPVNPALRRAQVAHILSDSGAMLLVTQAARAGTLDAGDVPPGCDVADEIAVPMAGEDGMAPSSADPDALAAILYTSGSTGRPKGVMLSHANLWLGAISVAHYLALVPGDRVLGVLPLSFDYGQNQLFSTWAAGASVAPLDYLTARDVVKA